MNTQLPKQSASISMMISEATYQAVVSITRVVGFCSTLLQSGK